VRRELRGEDGPTAGNALEFVVASRVEGDAGSRGEVGNGSRYEDLARTGEGSDSTGDVDCDAGDDAISAELGELARLHREGVLTPEEFSSAKARVLGS
jgi:hypothetical protein